MSTTSRMVGMRFFGMIFERYPRLAVVVYFLFTLLGLLGIQHTYHEQQISAEAPIPTTLEGAAPKVIGGKKRMKLTHVKWLCDDVTVIDKDQIVPITNQDGTALIIYEPKPDITCIDRPTVEGVLEPINDRHFDYLRRQNYEFLDRYDKNQIWSLWPLSTDENANIGYMLCSAFSLLMFAAMMVYWKKAFNKKPKPTHKAKRTGWTG